MTSVPIGGSPAAQAFGPGAAASGGHRWVVGGVGVLSIVVGLAALVWPGPTLLVVGILFGVGIGVSGVGLMVDGLTRTDVSTGVRLLDIVMGIAGAFVGTMLVVRPEASVVTVALILGFWCVLRGVTYLVLAVEPQGRWLNVLRGVANFAAGVIVLASPEIGIGTLVLIVGVTLIVQGCLELLLAFSGAEVAA